MRNILIISGASIRITPYAMIYINSALRNNCDVSVLVWHRDLIKDVDLDSRVNVIDYYDELDDSVPKVKKILNFLRFRRKINSVIKSKSYDFIVVLDTQFSVLICDILFRKFKNNYFVDMRDLSLENFKIFRTIVEKIIKCSRGFFISSDGYRQFLPINSKIRNLHNFREDEIKYRNENNEKNKIKALPIRISFWGCVRDVEINLQIIKKIMNDERILLNYYGSMSNESTFLKRFCEENQVKNIFFHGAYEPSQKIEFVKNTDLILNMYSNYGEMQNPSMGNKFYDSLIFKIPQLCNCGGFMGEYVSKNDVGLVLSVDDNFVDNIISYYQNYDVSAFSMNCNMVFDKIYQEHQKSLIVIDEALKG